MSFNRKGLLANYDISSRNSKSNIYRISYRNKYSIDGMGRLIYKIKFGEATNQTVWSIDLKFKTFSPSKIY